MELINKKPLIIVLSGKMRVGKNITASIISELYNTKNKKSIIISYASYLKEYTKNITGWDLKEETKPRKFLQELGTDLIKEKINKNMLINRIIEDIKVYSYFFDVIIISDARYIEEIESIKKEFNHVISIHIIKNTNINSNHITEISLDNYNNYDYIIENNIEEELYNKVKGVVKSLW